MRVNPKVSVVVPAYNSAATIGRALASIAAQDYPDLDILVVDDASADETCRVVEHLGMPEVRLFRHERNRGAAAARNTAIFEARGDYIAFLDADDIWLPGKLRAQVPELDRNPDVSLVACDCVIVDQHGNFRKRSHVQNRPVGGPHAWKALLASNFIPTPAVLTRRRLLTEAGGFNTNLPVAEDLDLWIRLALAGEVSILPQVYVQVYDSPGSLMKRGAAGEEKLLMSVVEQHLNAQRSRLTADEIRRIRGKRCFQIAAKYFDHHLYKASCAPFWRSARARYRPVKSIVNLVRAYAMSVVSRPAS